MTQDLLSSRCGIVTGSAQGIGLAIARLAIQEGASVMLTDINEQAGQEMAQQLCQEGGNAAFFPADVSKPAAMEELVKHTVETFGGLHWAVNNVASGPIDSYGKLMADLDEEEWETWQRYTLKSVWVSMKYEIPELLKHGGGAIANISSMAGVTGTPGLSAYSAAKGGVIALSKVAAAEYAPMGIRVNSVSPGMVLTPGNEKFLSDTENAKRALDAHALNRYADPMEIAHIAIFLCSDRASFMTGENVAVDGGSQVKATTYP